MPTILSAFLNARGAPPPLAATRLAALARRGPRALPIQRLGTNRRQPGTSAIRLIIISISAAASLLLPAAANAEYTRVELKIFGMDCAICAHGVRVAVQKVEGVESVELSLERAQADIRLQQGNRVPLDRFRQIVKGIGLEPKEATVTATGTIRETGGRLSFEVSGVGTTLIVSHEKTPAAVLKTLKAMLDAKAPLVDVVGAVTTGKDGIETIVVTSARGR